MHRMVITKMHCPNIQKCFYGSMVLMLVRFVYKSLLYRDICFLNVSTIGGGLAEIMASNDGSKSTSKETPPLTGVALTIRSLRISANLNCSVCYLKLGDAERAIHFAQRAIDLGIISDYFPGLI
jgi:hypothetical protein